MRHIILPVITVSVFSIARNARLIRSAMLEAQPGTSGCLAPAWRNAVSSSTRAGEAPVPCDVIALEFGFLLGGVIVTESVFAWPGVGRLVYTAIGQRDIPVVLAAVVFFAFVFVAINLIVDVLYAYLDPRIRLR